MRANRHELKYYLNQIDTEGLLHKLSQLMSFDSNGDPNSGYRVRSLYFDSIDDECLYQKQSGLLERKKFRMRTYGETENALVKFEIKRKYGQWVSKDSAIISQKDAERVIAGDHSALLDYQNPILDEAYATFSSRAYSPKVIVEYQRIALLMPVSNIRITFDLNLRSNINHHGLFSNVRDSMPVVIEGKQILEVKFDQFLPGYIKHVLASVNAERMAISKYTLARRFHKVQKWEDN